MAIPTASDHTNGDIGLEKQSHPSPIAFAHVVLRTTEDNFKPMVDFYVDMLQAEVISEAEEFSMLRYDFEHHRIAIVKMPQATPQEARLFTAGLEHTAYTHATLTDLAKTYRALKEREKSITPLWCVNHGMTTSIYYRDPDGNKVELQVDNFDTSEGADTFMRGPLFISNPIGTDFDPDEWSGEILSKMREDGSEGLSAEEVRRIKTRKEIGARSRVPGFVYGLAN
ncbi:uncharacterized protein Z519_04245 [Cladophialophora bantiana CBS 173.52]|uniref:VOC domain-containing protein n=1 Tax=Cladophialophora bantiana (strain ATCC 10958 / CBS 173.52 / CDC B-1940 / NIH 8579) TaxID=1442370 RepID=A0A0D2HXJ3_CLAB1|nr:uncharacterized protein Z519_04245 [Cladophialophora bantiana CBS 173.52]KIW95660.1 hypothetical protein Z519_04245 [Cladophialophora bantiana CBS 173.52]